MSFMRPQSSLRLVRAANVAIRPSRCFTTSTSKWDKADSNDASQAAVQTTEDSSSMVISEKTPDTYHPRNQPDYSVHIDHGTSVYSPVPRRVQDGSEPGETLPAAVLSGAPVDLQARAVKIYKQTKPATQSGSWGSHAWRLDWDPLPKGHRWENPLMGWASSADFMQGTKLQFKTKEDAVRFAERQGYEYYVQEPQERRFVPKAYANNFLHEPGPLKHIKTK